MNETNQSLLYKEGDIIVNIYLRGEHYLIWVPINFKKCSTCGRVIRHENEEHKCSQKMVTY